MRTISIVRLSLRTSISNWSSISKVKSVCSIIRELAITSTSITIK